ncbi:hypothetical protein EXN68_07800 [Rhizobium rhizogenes]|uniref:Uncharacterized protein n=1 Tax=Rhizobium rhizogenes TaxID=359 RepID=A0A546XKY5_RHIRH|nr:hypothetical protein EXN68_07800 [Rhizobium rhizogenes]
MTDMIPPVGQSRFMLIHAPKQLMVLSIILTNRVNKRLRTVMQGNEKPATGSSRAGLEIVRSSLPVQGTTLPFVSSPRRGEGGPKGRMRGQPCRISESLPPHPAAADFSPSGRRNKQHPLNLSQT